MNNYNPFNNQFGYQTPPYNPNYYNQQQPQQNTNIIYVNGIEDAKNRYLMANSRYAFFDNDKQMIYIRTVDNTGKSDVKVFSYNEQAEQPKADYAVKSDFEKLKQQFDELKREVQYGRERSRETTSRELETAQKDKKITI